MPRFTKSLGFRLFFLLLLVGLAMFFLLSEFMIRLATQHLMEEIIFATMRTNDVIEGSIHHSMLENRKEDVAQIIKTLGRGSGVAGIRIYNKKGRIVFSTDERELGQAVDLNAEQCTVCHSSEKPLEYIPDATRPRVFNQPNGQRVLAVVNPIKNEPACAQAGCHPPPEQQKILGVLDSKMSIEHVDKNIAKCKTRLIWMSILAVSVIEIFAGLFIWRMVLKQVTLLSGGTKEVKKGNLDFTLEAKGQDELSDLTNSFNTMVGDLKKAREQNLEWSKTLEHKVEQKTKELRLAQEQMVHVARMAAMGKLATTVAHEINNPLGGILTYIKLLHKQLSTSQLSEEERTSSAHQLEMVINEIKRCGNIVKNMLHFSKSTDLVFETVNLHDLIDKSLFIVNHQLELKEIQLDKQLNAENAELTGNSNQLQQALISLFINAVEAMDQGGTLTVQTADEDDDQAIRVFVKDTGIGIPQEMQSKIFEPFFTTKEETHGVGLGLAVVYGIIQTHRGTITVESQPGVGTTFILTFPRVRSTEQSDD